MILLELLLSGLLCQRSRISLTGRLNRGHRKSRWLFKAHLVYLSNASFQHQPFQFCSQSVDRTASASLDGISRKTDQISDLLIRHIHGETED